MKPTSTRPIAVLVLLCVGQAARANEIWVSPRPDKGTLGIGDWAATTTGAARFSFAVPDNLVRFLGAKLVVIGRPERHRPDGADDEAADARSHRCPPGHRFAYDVSISVSRDGTPQDLFVDRRSGLGPVVVNPEQLVEIDVSEILPAESNPGMDVVSLRFESRPQGHLHAVGLRVFFEGPAGPQGLAGPPGPPGPPGASGDAAWEVAGANAVARVSGSVGIGVANPVQKLDVSGGLRLGDAEGCSSTEAGSLRWNAQTREFDGFDGDVWVSLSRAGALTFRGQQRLETAGPGSFVVPEGIGCVTVELWGGGGGGGGGSSTAAGGGGGGGGGGGYLRVRKPVTPGGVLTLSVGHGGAGGGLDLAGSEGQSSSVSFPDGSTFLASGGQFGAPGTSAGPGGAGGNGGSGDGVDATITPGGPGTAGDSGSRDPCTDDNGVSTIVSYGGPGGSGGTRGTGLYLDGRGAGGAGGRGRTFGSAGPIECRSNAAAQPGVAGENGLVQVTW